MREFLYTLFPREKPKFHEISTYLISFSFCWLFIFHPELRQGLYIFFSGFGTFSIFFLTLGLIVVGGLLLSLAHPFIQRKKSPLEKAIMVWFIMGLSGVASFFVGVETLPSRASGVMILPVWNIIVSIMLLIQMGRQKYDLSNKEASLEEVIGTTLILIIILALADLYLRLSWAMTISISIFYATTTLFIFDWIINYFDLQLPNFMNEED